MKTKAELRKEQVPKIKQWMSDQTKLKNFYYKLFMSKEFKNADSIAITISMPGELDTGPIIQQSWDEHKSVYVPRTYPKDHSMKFFKYDSDTEFSISDFGVSEPKNGRQLKGGADLTIVPTLAIAMDSMQRIGFGGGYYDRYLKKNKTNTLALAIPPIMFPTANWKINPYDVQIDGVITQ